MKFCYDYFGGSPSGLRRVFDTSYGSLKRLERVFVKLRVRVCVLRVVTKFGAGRRQVLRVFETSRTGLRQILYLYSLHIDPPPVKAILYTDKEAREAANGLTDHRYNVVYTLATPGAPPPTKAAGKQVTSVETLDQKAQEAVEPEPAGTVSHEEGPGADYSDIEAIDLGLETRAQRRTLEDYLAARGQLTPVPVSVINSFRARVFVTGAHGSSLRLTGPSHVFRVSVTGVS